MDTDHARWGTLPALLLEEERNSDLRIPVYKPSEKMETKWSSAFHGQETMKEQANQKDGDPTGNAFRVPSGKLPKRDASSRTQETIKEQEHERTGGNRVGFLLVRQIGVGFS